MPQHPVAALQDGMAPSQPAHALPPVVYLRLDDVLPGLRSFDRSQRQRLARLGGETQRWQMTHGGDPITQGDDFAIDKINQHELGDLIFLYDFSAQHDASPAKYAALLAAHTCNADDDGAAQAVRAAANLGTSRGELCLHAGEILLQTSRSQLAFALLDIARQTHPNTVAVLERVAWGHCLHDRPQQAAHAMAQASDLAAAGSTRLSAIGHAALGEVALFRGHYVVAIEHCGFVAAQQPKHRSGALGLALAYARSGQQLQAQQAADTAMDHLDGSVAALTRLAELCGLLNNGAFATRVYALALKTAPQQAALFRDLAAVFDRLEDFEQTAQCLQYIVSLGKTLPFDFYELDNLWRKLNRPACAQQALQAGMQAHPKDPGLCFRLAQALLTQKVPAADARLTSLLRKAHLALPKDVERATLYANSLRASGQHVAAADLLWVVAPHSGQARHHLSFIAATAYMRERKYSRRTETILRACIDAGVEVEHSTHLLGALLCRTKRLAEGAALLAQVEASAMARQMQALALAGAGIAEKFAKAALHEAVPARVGLDVVYQAWGQAGCGLYLGVTADGRYLVEDRQRGLVCCDSVQNDTMGSRPDLVDSVPRSRHYTLSQPLQRHLSGRIQQAIHGTMTVAELQNQVQRYGGQLLMVGGVLRDALVCLHGTALVPLVDDLVPQDVDCVVNMLPSVVSILALGSRGDGPKISTQSHCFGVVQLTGGDVATVRVSGMYAPRRVALGCRHPIWALGFGDDLMRDAMSRDFCCNAVYYDMATQTLLDPTGFGISDATEGVLRVPSEAFILLNQAWVWRYAYMRVRGWRATQGTLAYVRRSAQHLFSYDGRTDEGRQKQRQLGAQMRRISVHINPSEPALALPSLLQVLSEDGLDSLVQRYIEPMRHRGLWLRPPGHSAPCP